MSPVGGLHHMTAICADAQSNIDFYAGVLGLRLVKVTVNFDDPTAYHLYYGDETGRPGTALTFFPYPDGRQGIVGAGQVARTDLAVPRGSLDFWTERLPGAIREDDALLFADPDGLPLALVESDDAAEPTWTEAIDGAHAIRGMHGIRLLVWEASRTAEMLTERLGFKRTGAEGSLHHFEAPGKGPFRRVTIEESPSASRGHGGHGTVHHIAFRTSDGPTQETLREDLIRHGAYVSPLTDRTYFRSIYFREPGGVLFEVATLEPGFTVDEPVDTLGSELRLPPQYESARDSIVRAIAPIRLPDGTKLP
jgi:glyoxalase family protein